MQNKVIKVLAIIACIALLVSLGANVYAISSLNETAQDTVSSISLMLTSVFAIYYILAGAKKGEGTTYFRVYMALFGLVMLLSILFYASYIGGFVVFMALSFGCLSILFVAKDLGVKWSVGLSLVVVVCGIIAMLVGPCLSSATHLLLSLVTLLMVCAKYADKKARGSK